MDDRLKDIIESLIFVSPEPLSLKKIKNVLSEFPEEVIERAVEELVSAFSSNQRGIQVSQAAGGYLFTTRREYDPWIRRLLRIERKNRLSGAALETLSVIAYNQPLTLAKISAMRGVDSTYALKTLLQKKLVRIVGRKKAPGRPLIYRTTEKFLTYFGLSCLEDLPSEEELSKIMEEEQAGENE